MEKIQSFGTPHIYTGPPLGRTFGNYGNIMIIAAIVAAIIYAACIIVILVLGKRLQKNATTEGAIGLIIAGLVSYTVGYIFLLATALAIAFKMVQSIISP